MSPATWEAELRLHRLTVAPWYLTSPRCLISHLCKELNMSAWRMPVCKMIAGSLTEWEKRLKGREWEKETSTVRGETIIMKRGGWKEGGTEHTKARTVKRRHGEGERGEEMKKRRAPQWEASPCWLLLLDVAADGFKRAPGSLGLRF